MTQSSLASGIYKYFEAKGIDPAIPLNPRSSQLPKPTGTAQRVNKEGIPICPAGLLMRRHSKGKDNKIFFNCPAKRPTHKDNKHTWNTYVELCPQKLLCQPDTKMGPVVYVRSNEDLRLYPKIQRESLLFKELMNLRTVCERSNSTKKITYKLDQRVCRNEIHYLFRLYLISIIEHAKVWLECDKKKAEKDYKKLYSLDFIATQTG